MAEFFLDKISVFPLFHIDKYRCLTPIPVPNPADVTLHPAVAIIGPLWFPINPIHAHTLPFLAVVTCARLNALVHRLSLYTCDID